ncbi:unnamed protein product, partial [marine sediment metagenome]
RGLTAMNFIIVIKYVQSRNQLLNPLSHLAVQ